MNEEALSETEEKKLEAKFLRNWIIPLIRNYPRGFGSMDAESSAEDEFFEAVEDLVRRSKT